MSFSISLASAQILRCGPLLFPYRQKLWLARSRRSARRFGAHSLTGVKAVSGDNSEEQSKKLLEAKVRMHDQEEALDVANSVCSTNLTGPNPKVGITAPYVVNADHYLCRGRFFFAPVSAVVGIITTRP